MINGDAQDHLNHPLMAGVSKQFCQNLFHSYYIMLRVSFFYLAIFPCSLFIYSFTLFILGARRDDGPRGGFDDGPRGGFRGDRGRGGFGDRGSRGGFNDRDDRGHRDRFDDRGPPRDRFDDRGPPRDRFDDRGPPRDRYDDRGSRGGFRDDRGPPRDDGESAWRREGPPARNAPDIVPCWYSFSFNIKALTFNYINQHVMYMYFDFCFS